MLTPAEQQWSQTEQFNMAQLSTSDLQDLDNLFEFGDIDLNIADVDPATFTDHIPQQAPQHATHPSTPYNDATDAPSLSDTMAQDFGAHNQFNLPNSDPSHQFMPRDGSQVPKSMPFPSEALFQPAIRQQYVSSHPQQFHYQAGYPSGHHIPPTPTSFEMHGEAAHFMHHHQPMDAQQRAILEQRYHVRKDDATAFTPMVSPAGTPQYNLQPEFTVPGAYFSPLTSPMLHAQNDRSMQQPQHPQQHLQHQGYYNNSSTAPSSNAASPVDHHAHDTDMITDGLSLSEPAGKKSARRKVATMKNLAANARLRSSPVQKAQKRKPGKLPTSVENLVLEAQRSNRLRSEPDGLHLPSTFNFSSEEGSISPEPLSESLMPPPRRPTSGLPPSPLCATFSQDLNLGLSGPAATPNSILSLRNGQPSAAQAVQPPAESGNLDDFRLPEAAESQRQPLPPINTRIISAVSEESTPRMSARKTPKLGPLSTPSSARPSSAKASPVIVGSPMSGTTPTQNDKKSDVKGLRNNKKRSSTGANSALVSPALRPRISPSIKPLLPEGTALHSPTHALLLASKSNYQNLLEGNHLPGVNYPDSLSTGLTSKRTSHKVAEQGRRNRINEALKEMQSLLPKTLGLKNEPSGSDGSPGPPDLDNNGKESKEDAAAKSNSSKAATVESANEYIRRLKKEHAEKDVSMALLQQKMEALERRLRRRTVGDEMGDPGDQGEEEVRNEGRCDRPPSIEV